MNEKTEKKMCPQCDGVGQEDVGTIPVKCRKCLGFGEIESIKRIGLFSLCGDLVKQAQTDNTNDNETHPADQTDAPHEDEEDNETVGLGYDPLSILRPDMTPQELQSGIFSTLKGFSPDDMKLALKEVCEMNGVSEDSALEQCKRETTTEHGVMRYVYVAVDSMDTQQLRDFYRALRLVSGRR